MKKRIALLMAVAALLVSGCSKPLSSTTGNIVMAKDGEGDANIGDTIRTYFFDATVNSAYLTENYKSITPSSDGKELLVVNITVKNTTSSVITMYDTDFQGQWGGEGEEDYCFPVTYDGNESIGNMLPAAYELKTGQSETGDLVYEMPEGLSDFAVAYIELFDDESTGNVFFIYFSAEKK